MSSDVTSQQMILSEALRDGGASQIGFADVSVVEDRLTQSLPVAVSLGVAYHPKVVENLHIDEAAFHEHLLSLNRPLEHLIELAKMFLSKWGYRVFVPPISVLIESNSELRTLRTFPHKTAATRAGLGWIGKCALFVSQRFGPRIKLAAVLTDAPFEVARPVTGDSCGSCKACVDACPYGAISNVNWSPTVSRDQLVDVFLCNEKRLEFVPSLSRKHSCGLCLRACRVGSEMGGRDFV